MTPAYSPTPVLVNVMLWCRARLNPIAGATIISANPEGLSDQAVETALRIGDYVKVLTLVWAERNREARLEWLQEDRLKFHPILPYERALAEFKASPTLDTITRISRPLLLMGRLRNAMDAECSEDESIEASCKKMDDTYYEAFALLLNQHIPSFENFSSEDHMTNLRNSIAFLRELEEELEKETPEIPSPKWLEYCGENPLRAPGMKPEESWNPIRLAFVQSKIAKLESALEALEDSL
jgi:hypothetical protein